MIRACIRARPARASVVPISPSSAAQVDATAPSRAVLSCRPDVPSLMPISGYALEAQAGSTRAPSQSMPRTRRWFGRRSALGIPGRPAVGGGARSVNGRSERATVEARVGEGCAASCAAAVSAQRLVGRMLVPAVRSWYHAARSAASWASVATSVRIVAP